MSSGLPVRTRQRRPRRWGRWLFCSFLVLLALLLATVAYFYWRLDRAVDESNSRVPADVWPVLTEPGGGISGTPVNILVLGSDQRPGESARADTILVLRVDGGTRTISQLSIPRDTLADIPGYGEGKINSAYAYGGPALQIQAVEELTGLPIHHYLEIDFAGFPRIVDSLGGVEIDVPKTIDSLYPAGLEWTEVHFDAGPQQMDGETALTFVRVRYSDDDFQRMGRQQLFMEALQKRFTTPDNLVKMPWLAPEIISSMTTDLTTNELLLLSWIKTRTPAEKNRKFVLPGESQDIDGVSFVVIDEAESKVMIRDFLSAAGGS